MSQFTRRRVQTASEHVLGQSIDALIRASQNDQHLENRTFFRKLAREATANHQEFLARFPKLVTSTRPWAWHHIGASRLNTRPQPMRAWEALMGVKNFRQASRRMALVWKGDREVLALPLPPQCILLGS